MAAGSGVIVVDTSVWAAFFNGEETALTTELDRLLAGGEGVTILPVILMEVLQGFRLDESFDQARHLLTSLPILFPSLETHVLAAHLYRTLRRQGVTVRGTIDCLIAQTCMETGTSLVTGDRDFEFIARHTSLQLHRP